MSTDDTARLIQVLADRSARLAADFARTAADRVVPTCPDWTAADLIGHLGGVQRFVTDVVTRQRRTMPDDHDLQAMFTTPDRADSAALIKWFDTGAAGVTAALRGAPADLETIVFLADPGPARHYWARRQAHEATVHGVDMLAARLGRFPTTAEAAVERDLAVDGIDEFLGSFLPRPESTLHSDRPYRVAVEATDAPSRWTVRVSAEPPEALRHAPDDDPVDLRLRGSAADLYLSLWGRGGQVRTTGPAELQAHWRAHTRV